jgi:hypothetical protein
MEIGVGQKKEKKRRKKSISNRTKITKMKVVAILLISLGLALAMVVPPSSIMEQEQIQKRGNGIIKEERELEAVEQREVEQKEIALEETKREIMKEERELEAVEKREVEQKEIALEETKREIEMEKREFHEMAEREVQGERAAFNSTQCVYNPESKIFSCRGAAQESVVECPAIFEWEGEQSFNLFGLGFADASRYWLYPRSLDNSTYLNHSLIVEGVVRDLFLYFGDKRVEYGFRVTEESCFERLVNLIKISSVEHVCSVEGDLAVPMIGEVLLVNSEISKRWGFGYGYGMGLGGWGYGGLGYGGLYGMGMYGLYGR